MKVVRIAITGPESAGKTSLSEALAAHFHAPLCREYARTYLQSTGGHYTESDLIEICRGQIASEEEALAKADRCVVFDTDVLVLKIWALFRFGRVPQDIERAQSERRYDVRLLCKPDLPWTPDPYRESPQQSERDLLFSIFEKQLQADRANYTIVSGAGGQRLETALKGIAQFAELAENR